MGMKDKLEADESDESFDKEVDQQAKKIAEDVDQPPPQAPALAPEPTIAENAAPAAPSANPMPAADNSDIAPPQTAQSQPQQMPSSMQAAAPTPAPAPPGPPTAAEYNAHDAQLAKDAETKQLNPKTFADMWHDKGVLGKIGTLFGLILGGAGAGLTHGPNVVLDMMNKEIDRDLEAQRQNVANKQNFISMNYQHELQMAQAKHMQYENQLASAQAGAIPSENALRASQSEALNAQNAGLASYNRAKNTALIAAFQDLKDKNANNPAAQPALEMLGQSIQGQMQQNNAKAAASQQINTAKQQQPLTQAPVDLARMQKMITVGKSAPDMPGAIPPQDVPSLTKETQEVQENRNYAKIYDDSFKKLDKMAAAGAINKNARAAQVATLGAALARSTTGRYNQQEAFAQAEGMFPSITDWGGVRDEKYRKAMQYFEGNEAATPTLDRYGLKNPFPQYSFGKQKKQSSSSVASAPVERKTQDGKTALFDPKTKQFLGYKNESSNTAIAGDE